MCLNDIYSKRGYKTQDWEEQEVAPGKQNARSARPKDGLEFKSFSSPDAASCSKLEPDNRKIPWWNRQLVNAVKFSIVGFKTSCTLYITTTGLSNYLFGRIQMTLNSYGLFDSNS